MKRLVLVAAAVIIGTMFCAPLYAQDAAAGEKVFARERCNMCHTATRNSLNDVGAKLKAAEIRQWIVNPTVAAQAAKSTAKPPMRSFAKLSKEDVDSLVAYLQTMKGGK